MLFSTRYSTFKQLTGTTHFQECKILNLVDIGPLNFAGGGGQMILSGADPRGGAHLVHAPPPLFFGQWTFFSCKAQSANYQPVQHSLVPSSTLYRKFELWLRGAKKSHKMMLNFQIFLGEGPPFGVSRLRRSQVRASPSICAPPFFVNPGSAPDSPPILYHWGSMPPCPPPPPSDTPDALFSSLNSRVISLWLVFILG